VLIPAVSPFIASEVRISAVISLFIAIVCELLAGTPGNGNLLVQRQLIGDTAGMWALILLTGILGLTINPGFRFSESHLLRWHPAYAKEGRHMVTKLRRGVELLGLPAVLITAWWLGSANSQSVFFPPLGTILEALVAWVPDGFARHIVPSVVNLLAGFGLATFFGGALGVLLGRVRLLDAALSPIWSSPGPCRNLATG
jgi:ABC-type nitrate/sulfonate/bicarbonate transport system permease component